MNIQELIDKLNTIKDKEKPVVLSAWSIGNPFRTVKEIQTNMLVDQPHKLNILSE
jgi:hypothetical protein